MIGLKRGTVTLAPYNPYWKKLFEQEKELLLKTFDDRIIGIEHIGSTAIEGLSAKPIIDINVGVHSLDDTQDFLETLPTLGYEYMPERLFTDRHFFPKGLSINRTHHLNLVETTSETGWRIPLLFRDYLRAHPEACAGYEKIKQELAEEYPNDRGEYSRQKNAFIEGIVKKTQEEIR